MWHILTHIFRRETVSSGATLLWMLCSDVTDVHNPPPLRTFMLFRERKRVYSFNATSMPHDAQECKNRNLGNGFPKKRFAWKCTCCKAKHKKRKCKHERAEFPDSVWECWNQIHVFVARSLLLSKLSVSSCRTGAGEVKNRVRWCWILQLADMLADAHLYWSLENKKSSLQTSINVFALPCSCAYFHGKRCGWNNDFLRLCLIFSSKLLHFNWRTKVRW